MRGRRPRHSKTCAPQRATCACLFSQKLHAPYRRRRSARARSYSYGVILWELLTCDVPWRGLNEAQIIKKVCGGERPPIPDEIDPALRPLRELMERSWVADAAERPAFDAICKDLPGVDLAGFSPHAAGALAPAPAAPAADAADFGGLVALFDRLHLGADKLALAAAYFAEIGAESVDELVEEGFAEAFVERCALPALRKKKLREALEAIKVRARAPRAWRRVRNHPRRVSGECVVRTGGGNGGDGAARGGGGGAA